MPSIGANIGLSIAAGMTGLRVDPYQGCNFVVEIGQLLVGGFTEIGGLQVQTDVYEYREGGVNGYVHRFAGATQHPLLILKHGLSPIDGMWAWHQDVVAGVIQRRNGTIYLLDKQQMPLMWWDFSDALPVKWTGPDLRAESASVAFESLELAHHGLSRPRLATASTGIAGELAMTGNLPGGFF
jgi:phage tail-like protein